MAKKNALGRGLGALLGEAQNKTTNPSAGQLSLIEVEKVESNPFQPRTSFEPAALEELSQSIAVHGVIQPITVRRLSENEYQLISGERRLKATKLAGLDKIPAYVVETSEQGMMEMALIENIQREDLNAIEIAISYKRLMEECNLILEDLAQRVGKSRSTVNNYTRLLKLPPEIQLAIRDQVITMGHARALINLETSDEQLYIFREIAKKGLSVRQVEEMARNTNSNKEKSKSIEKGTKNVFYTNVESNLRSKFETKVEIKVSADDKGNITIPFFSEDDFNRILELLEA